MKILIVVDFQQDFAMPDGSLAVKDGMDCLIPINKLLRSGKFDFVIATKDMHPLEHCSFKSNGGQWNEHCVAGTDGAEFAFSKQGEGYIDVVWHKGRHADKEEYSPFSEDNPEKFGDLIVNADEVYICGLALDFCVKQTAIDCKNFCDKIFVFEDAVKAVFTDKDSMEKTLADYYTKNIKFITSEEFLRG